MVKVYLVEDEIIIRQSIKNSIDWEKEGYEFVGDASDGELALPVILKEKPDILITDIRMPFMDGLELSRMVKAELPDIKIVILSGYDDFEYAKQAIKIGVAEYLLKPVSSAVLLEHLSEIAETVRDEREDLALKKATEKEHRFSKELLLRDRTAATVRHLQLERALTVSALRRHGRFIPQSLRRLKLQDVVK